MGAERRWTRLVAEFTATTERYPHVPGQQLPIRTCRRSRTDGTDQLFRYTVRVVVGLPPSAAPRVTSTMSVVGDSSVSRWVTSVVNGLPEAGIDAGIASS